jgi:hypothetical protein
MPVSKQDLIAAVVASINHLEAVYLKRKDIYDDSQKEEDLVRLNKATSDLCQARLDLENLENS